MNQKEQIVCTYLFCIFEGIVIFVKVDKPSIVSGVSGDNVMCTIFGLGRDVAPVRYIFDSQRRLKLDFVAFLFERSKGLKFKYKVWSQVDAQLYFECSESTVWTSDRTWQIVMRVYMLEDNIISELHLLAGFSASMMNYASTREAYSLMTLLFYSWLLVDSKLPLGSIWKRDCL